MIVNFIFLMFILYLVFIYNKLQSRKSSNLESYIKHASLIIERLEKENSILKEQNNAFENQINETNSQINKLDQNINLKKSEIEFLNKNCNEEKIINQNHSYVFHESEKHLYNQISDLKHDSKKNDTLIHELREENISLKKEHEILYKFLKLSDYALYEEFLKNI